jgi:hypothetical protein
MFWKSLLFQLQYHLMLIPAIGQPLQMKVVGELQKGIDEASGIAILNSGTLAHINDGGHPPCVFFTDITGDILELDCPEFLHNHDWEALAYGADILFIGDIGNNRNLRRSMTIYRVGINSDLDLTDRGKISISFKEQRSFPPADSDRNYDVEAMIYHGGKLHLFTKNRTEPFDGYVYHYSFPAAAGEYVISRRDSFQTKTNGMLQNWVTGADLNPAGNILALVGYYKIWLFYDFPEDHFFSGQSAELLLNDESQKEAIAFTGDSTLLITDERSLIFSGGRIYEGKIEKKHFKTGQEIPVKLLSSAEIDSLIIAQINHGVELPVLWEIYGVKGDRVLFGKINESENTGTDYTLRINTSELPPGGYVLSIIVAGRPYAYKLKKLVN